MKNYYNSFAKKNVIVFFSSLFSDATLKQFTSDTFLGCNETMTFSDNYQPHVLETSMAERTSWLDNCLTDNQSTAKTKSYSLKKDRNNDDPFHCPLCDFATIYKVYFSLI